MPRKYSHAGSSDVGPEVRKYLQAQLAVVGQKLQCHPLIRDYKEAQAQADEMRRLSRQATATREYLLDHAWEKQSRAYELRSQLSDGLDGNKFHTRVDCQGLYVDLGFDIKFEDEGGIAGELFRYMTKNKMSRKEIARKVDVEAGIVDTIFTTQTIPNRAVYVQIETFLRGESPKSRGRTCVSYASASDKSAKRGHRQSAGDAKTGRVLPEYGLSPQAVGKLTAGGHLKVKDGRLDPSAYHEYMKTHSLLVQAMDDLANKAGIAPTTIRFRLLKGELKKYLMNLGTPHAPFYAYANSNEADIIKVLKSKRGSRDRTEKPRNIGDGNSKPKAAVKRNQLVPLTSVLEKTGFDGDLLDEKLEGLGIPKFKLDGNQKGIRPDDLERLEEHLKLLEASDKK